jgi:hypothetical protein
MSYNEIVMEAILYMDGLPFPDQSHEDIRRTAKIFHQFLKDRILLVRLLSFQTLQAYTGYMNPIAVTIYSIFSHRSPLPLRA